MKKQSDAKQNYSLMAGYGKVDITPAESMPLAGYGNSDQRMSRGYLEPLYATCVAIADEAGNTAVLFGMDTINTSPAIYQTIREEISKKHNIPLENIVVSASHNHSSPDLGVQLPAVQRWQAVLKSGMLECADQAIADLSPMQMSTASVETKGLNFVRRYQMEDGSVIGALNMIRLSGMEVTGYESPADPELRLLKLSREGKRDILLANFQTHPHRSAAITTWLLTPDLVGAFRRKLENDLKLDVVYFTGAAGNINPVSLIKADNATFDYVEQGKALAKYAIDAEGGYIPVSSGPIRAVCSDFEAQINHTTDSLVPVAREAQALWKETNSIAAITDAYLSYGIHSPYHANAIVARSGMPQTRAFQIFALAFGDAGFAVAPYEMFDTNGKFIKEHSPFPVTFVATCANGGNGYFPSKLSWENGGYEVDTTQYVEGTAEELADRYVEMLNSLAQ